MREFIREGRGLFPVEPTIINDSLLLRCVFFNCLYAARVIPYSIALARTASS